MKRSHIIAALATLASVSAFTACDDTTTTIGSTLGTDNLEIFIDSDFTITGHSVPVTAIRPKTSYQILGSIDIPGYGTFTSDFVAQFLPATELDTRTFTIDDLDSLVLTMRYARGAFIGDSTAPLGVTAYALTQQITPSITSDFNPDGYYDAASPLGSLIYSASTLTESDADKALSYRDIEIKLPLELGHDLWNAYVNTPGNYLDGNAFAKNVFPGVYVKNSYGNGRLTLISICAMSMCFTKITADEDDPEELDTTYQDPLYYLVTPEVVNNNILSYKMAPSLQQKLDDGKTLLIAPLGAEIEFTFPIEAMLERYRATGNVLSIINTLSMSIPVDTIETGYGVEPPPYVLAILKKDRDEFFEKNKLPDNVTSFYAVYNGTTQSYDFNSMRGYFTNMLAKEEITADDYTFSLVPVQVNFEDLANSSYYSTSASQTESEVLPYLASPAMGELHLDKAKIKFTYTLQTKK